MVYLKIGEEVRGIDGVEASLGGGGGGDGRLEEVGANYSELTNYSYQIYKDCSPPPHPPWVRGKCLC